MDGDITLSVSWQPGEEEQAAIMLERMAFLIRDGLKSHFPSGGLA